jgi:hypothetical protein
MSVNWLGANDLFPAAIAKILPVESILDIGCGIRPQNYIRPRLHICWEPFSQYIQHLLEKTPNGDGTIYLFVNAGWEEAIRLFPAKSVDSVFLLDVIEHLDKEVGRSLLAATENIARRQIVLFTPLGFLPQSFPDCKDKWGMDGGVWQEHKSGWSPEDFDPSWEVLVARKYHLVDNVRYGAIWAIKNIENPET